MSASATVFVSPVPNSLVTPWSAMAVSVAVAVMGTPCSFPGARASRPHNVPIPETNETTRRARSCQCGAGGTPALQDSPEHHPGFQEQHAAQAHERRERDDDEDGCRG